QRLQISDHAGASSFAAAMPLLALLLSTVRGAVPARDPRYPAAHATSAGEGHRPDPRAGNDRAAPEACAGPAPRGRIRRRVPRGPPYSLAVLPRLQQGLRDSAPCLVGGPERGHRGGPRRFPPSRVGGPAR